jgi:hypothetical protein
MLKMLVPMYQTTQHHIPEDHYLSIHHCENLNIKLPVITKTHMFISMNTKICFSDIHFSTVLTSKNMSPNGFLPLKCSVHKMHKLKSLKRHHDGQCLISQDISVSFCTMDLCWNLSHKLYSEPPGSLYYVLYMKLKYLSPFTQSMQTWNRYIWHVWGMGCTTYINMLTAWEELFTETKI